MIALYPGAFKPPHRGHFNVVKSLLDGSYNGSIYDKDNYKETGASLLSGNSNKKPKIDKVIVFVGAGERNGITKEESMSIWEVYSQYLGDIEILDGGNNPMFAAKDFAQSNPEEEFVSVTGIRGEKVFVDLRRVTTYKNAPNVKGLALAAAPGSGIRATDFRNNILSGNLDKVLDFFPEDLSKEQILNILTDLKDTIVAEILSNNLEGFIDNYFDKPTIDERSTAIRSVDRNRLVNLYNYLVNLIPQGTNIDLIDDKIIVKYDLPIGEQTVPNIELKDYIASLLEYMLDQKMNILPLPEIVTIKDKINAANFFGRTAYYSPSDKKVALYTYNRHPKDIVRSCAHEMIHHMQNLEGRLKNITTTNTNEDENLEELEKEAYLLGNITFRNWEDSLKNEGTLLSESNEFYSGTTILKENNEPKKGTGKKPKGSSRRLYTDEDPKDTVGVKFSTRQDIVDTLNKKSFKAKSHARQSQIINLIHQRVRAALGRTKDPAKKKKLKAGFEYIKKRKEASKKKTQRLKNSKK